MWTGNKEREREKEKRGEGREREKKKVPFSPSTRNDAVYTPGMHLHAKVCEKNQSFGVHSSGFNPVPSNNSLKQLCFHLSVLQFPNLQSEGLGESSDFQTAGFDAFIGNKISKMGCSQHFLKSEIGFRI